MEILRGAYLQGPFITKRCRLAPRRIKEVLKGVGCQNAFVNQALDLNLMPEDLMGSVSSQKHNLILSYLRQF